MATLRFIGLANYKPSYNNLVNIIFNSDKPDKTTYQYNFSTSSSSWQNIPTLIDVTIPALQEISAQLDTNTTDAKYYLYIRSITSSGVMSLNTIWQQSTSLTNTNSISNYISDYTLRGTNTTATGSSNYTYTTASGSSNYTYTTASGGSINNSTTTTTKG